MFCLPLASCRELIMIAHNYHVIVGQEVFEVHSCDSIKICLYVSEVEDVLLMFIFRKRHLIISALALTKFTLLVISCSLLLSSSFTR